ncbi:hypothetical protein F5Y06DRAFT_76436 [Hypoxylon sp. FL0890]|nr:hypothetical protein F5Y06DRAFT_76436 [Hypoxylon sp. FL0890]
MVSTAQDPSHAAPRRKVQGLGQELNALTARSNQHVTSAGYPESVISDYTVSNQHVASVGYPYRELVASDDTATIYEGNYSLSHELPNSLPGTLVLPCEFVGLGSCDVTFNYDETEAWIEHIVTDHLRDKLPNKAVCWFCDTHIFDAKAPEIQNDRLLIFRYRMEHIRKHIAEGKTVHDIRPDFHMLDHLHKHRLISEATYNQARRFHELPEHTRQQERSNRIVVDNRKEERQRRRNRNTKHRMVSRTRPDNECSSGYPHQVIDKHLQTSSVDSHMVPQAELSGALQHSDDVKEKRPSASQAEEINLWAPPKTLTGLQEENTSVCSDANQQGDLGKSPQFQAEVQRRSSGTLHNMNQGKYKKAEQIREHASSHSNIYPHDSESEESTLPSCNDSLFSEPMSQPSSMTQGSAIKGINSLLSQDFAAILCQDESMMSHILVATRKEDIGWERMRSEFRKMLKRYALNLKAEAHSDHHQAIVRFVGSFSACITRDVFSKFSTGGRETEFRIPESLQNIRDSREMVEEYLQKVLGPAKPIECNEDSDQDSTDEEFGEEEPYDGSLGHLDRMERFIQESIAYQILRRQVYDFVYPSLGSRLRDLVSSWSRPSHKYHDYIIRYKLSNLVAELQYINPDTIRFDYNEETDYLAKAVGYSQTLVELWTNERWDWWPLAQCSRPLKEGETRLRWECTCGEHRWTEVPSPFGKRLKSIIRSLPQSSTPVTQSPPVSFQGNGSGSTANRNNQSRGQPTQSSQSHNQPASSSSANAAQPNSWFPVTNIPQNMVSHRVLFIVKRGADYKMAQIGVSKHPCNVFFSTLRARYFDLRGFIRSWFSVWRYSHCDFYMCEKFDDHEFAPKHKNAFPEATNPDYEYRPKPMDSIPPVSEHEFQKRFYTCPRPQPLRHWYHKCKALGTHSYDILELFPKKKTELEEGGDKRETFWGIYAREIISLRWVLIYNLVCVCPMLVFFVAWILPAGQNTDLQDPSVPFSMMLGMLSLFWSVFLSSLQFGRSR